MEEVLLLLLLKIIVSTLTTYLWDGSLVLTKTLSSIFPHPNQRPTTGISNSVIYAILQTYM